MLLKPEEEIYFWFPSLVENCDTEGDWYSNRYNLLHERKETAFKVAEDLSFSLREAGEWSRRGQGEKSSGTA